MSRQRSANQKSARLDPDQYIRAQARNCLGKAINRFAPSLSVHKQRPDIVKQDAWFGIIGDRTNVFFKI